MIKNSHMVFGLELKTHGESFRLIHIRHIFPNKLNRLIHLIHLIAFMLLEMTSKVCHCVA